MVAREPEALAAALGAAIPDGVTLPQRSWNVAPTDTVSIVVARPIENELRRQLHPARWGLIPPWASDATGAARLVNARIETVADKPSFAGAVRSRRCLVLADGYYEWQRRTDGKQPFYIHAAGGEPIYFAGIYSWWADPRVEGDDPRRWVLTASILTCPSAGEAAQLHDRMPVALTPDACEEWLRATPADVPELLAYLPGVARQVAATWISRAVTAAVGSVRNNGPQLIEEIPRT